MPKLLKAGKHTCLGALQGESVSESDTDSMLERPGMLVYCGKFDSMDGPVEITEHHLDLMMKHHEGMSAKLKRLFGDVEIPVRMMPPLQVDHSPSAMMTVGRVVGRLYKGVYTNLDGENVPALFSDRIRVLGKENVEKVKDGRWADVSIGADLESGKLNELSITPFPAAQGATLLKRLSSHNGVEYEIKEVEPGEYDIYVAGQKVTHHAGTPEEVESEAKRYIEHEKKEIGMHEKLKKHLMEHRKLSEKEAEELSKKMREHHMKHMGLDDDKMSKHLEAADDKEMSRMSEEYDKHLKHLAENPEGDKEKEEKEKKMAAAKSSFITLAKGIKTSTTSLKGEVRMAAVNSRLAGLRKLGKITPAEIKKIDVAKLANLSAEACEAALSTWETREPVLNFGASAGSVKADAIDKVAKKYRMQRMELESRLNMPSKRAEAQAMLAKLAEEEKHEMSRMTGHEEEPSKGMLTKVSYDELVKMLEDKDRHEELKKHLMHFVDIHGDGASAHMSEGDEKRMSAIANSHAELQNKFDELVSIVAPALGISVEELKN